MSRIVVVILFVVPWIQDVSGGCSRIPQGASGERSAVDENFKILIDGNPETYIPDHQYNVSLSCPISLKFISFTLVVESEDPGVPYNAQDVTGHFELYDSSETRFSAGCENMVESTNTNAKTRIDVSWMAPKLPDSGCVLIKAGIVQHRDVWFIDDGFLTKRICPEEIDELNSLTPPLQNCCACDEAKYEIVLERKWARNTHAKDFPPEAWRTRLGEIIGASHSYSYRYWAYGGRASQGMRELAEHGATRTLEQEIRDNTQNGEVRTIIKAPGIGHRLNVFGTTLANARVDPQHHQISLAAKIDPSPDWIVGVAGLELCLSNCTWLERKVLNLYPWDIGTDSGPSYMSADQPQVPPDVIRRITSSYPSDPRSPFYDDSGAPMKPLATLYLTRKKSYMRECEEVPQEGPLECATHPWNDWSNCSTRCGSGYSQRFRSYKNPALATSYSCDRRLEEMRQCQGTQCGNENDLGNAAFDNGAYNNPNGPDTIAECELGTWSDWSPCSKTCGRGISTRTRDYYNPQARSRCQTVMRIPLEESRQCTGSDCGGTIADHGDFDGLKQPEVFGETSEDGYDKPAWGLNANRNRQGWNNNLAAASPTEFPRGPFSNRGTEVYNKPNSYNDNREEKVPNNFNDYRQENRGNNEDYKQPNKFNDYRQDNKLNNYNNIEQSPEYNLRPGFSTRAPSTVRYGNRQPDASGNYNVMQDYCYEKPFASTQPCLANPVIVRNYWFYDHDDHECKIFTTDNCDENNNRFRTLMACEGTCLLPQINLARTEEGDTMNPYGVAANPYGGAPTPMNSYGGAPMQVNPYGGAPMQVNPYGGAANSMNPYAGAGSPMNPYAGAGSPMNPYAGDAVRASGGFGEPMSQTKNKYNNAIGRRGRYGS
ncbi:GH22805 [Drosophila grimshawi]|uniref:Spondin-1 n=2 Tax=Drosophila grimshawi TaxID=7222 RepID=B4JW57_DROGR|nr:GH22805 [Drosophila grimshawi]